MTVTIPIVIPTGTDEELAPPAEVLGRCGIACAAATLLVGEAAGVGVAAEAEASIGHDDAPVHAGGFSTPAPSSRGPHRSCPAKPSATPSLLPYSPGFEHCEVRHSLVMEVHNRPESSM